MVIYDLFFRRYGVRLPQHLMTPNIATIDKFEFPRNSVFHNVTFDGVHVGPTSDEYLFREVTKQILMDHIVDLKDSKGSPRKITAAILPYIHEYHLKNRRFRYIKDLTKLSRDETILMVLNYGFLSKLYRYTRSMYTEYFKWWNTERTVWDTSKEVSELSNRHQFTFTSLPKILPSVNTLNTYSKVFNASIVKLFPTPESLFILEIWKWLGQEHRSESVFSTLTPESLSKINIVFQESNSWIMINLGVLDSWRFDEAKEQTGITQNVRITPADLQKRFLRMLMTLMSTRVISGETDVVEEEQTQLLGATDHPEEHTSDEVTRLERADKTLDTMDSDLKELEIIEKHSVVEDNIVTQVKTGVVNISDFHTEDTEEGAILKICDRLAEDGLLTAATYRNLINSSKSYKTIVSPDGVTKLDEFIKIDPEVIKIEASQEITPIDTVVDKSMLKSSLIKFDKDYIEKVLAKDVAGMVVNIQKAGVILSGYTVEKENDILGDYEVHSVRVRPVEGTSSTLRFKLPTVSSDGTFTYNGNKYRMRKQRGDNPIRKISPDTVALTSYYGKVFAKRNPKKVNNYASWLCNQIMLKGLDASDTDISNLATAAMFDNTFKCPRLYSTLAMQFKSFTANSFHFNFDHNKRAEYFGKDNVKKYETDSLIIVAKNDLGSLLAFDKNGAVYELKEDEHILRGSFEEFINIEQGDSPVEFAELKIFGKNIPIGFILAYQLGLTNLLNMLKVEPRKVPAGQRLNLDKNEFYLAFSDFSLVFNRDDRLPAIILAGFKEYGKALRKYTVASLDKQNVYLNLLESVGMGPRYLLEIDLFTNLFVDPITKEILIEMKEPTSVRGLLVRSAELLLNDQHPDQLDLEYMRIKGYERMAGAVYSEMVQSIRAHNSRAGKATRPLELNPYAVWQRIVQDPSINMVSDINPIENLKQMEAVTYSGVGGRNARSMTKATREYHDSDTGVISESTVDSSHVGVNIYTSADPQFKSLRGTTRRYEIGKTGATALLSTSALLSPGSDHDDPKRVNFVGIQHSHGIACSGYKQSSVRTGYEQIIAHRTGDLFADTAKQDGKVVSKTNTGIILQFADGSTKSYEIGRRYGAAAGLVIPHEVVCDLQVGDEFKSGDIISYNSGFFEKDILNPKQVVWKAGVTVKTVLLESSQTLEDASSISKRLADKLTTKTTKIKTVVVSFDQIVKSMVKPGDAVEPESILCVIEDAVTSNSNLFDEESLDTLRLLSNQTPTPKVRGVVERIEVYYHGQKEDMSDSLRDLAGVYDRELSKRYKSLGKGSVTGMVNSDLRIDGNPLSLDNMAIKFYITSDVSAGIGD